MNPRSVFKGTRSSFHEIPLGAIKPQNCSITLEDVRFPTSFDLGKDRVVVPASPPAWIDQELPVQLSPDDEAIDPRDLLPSCPLEPLLRAMMLTAPDISVKDIDLIVDRKNLRALFNFVNGGKVNHRIDAELIGNTLLFYVGWSGFSYDTPGVTYGMNFEHKFTSPTPGDIVNHKRVIQYKFGGLNVLTKYQVDAYISNSDTPSLPSTDRELVSTPSTNLQVFRSGTMIPPECVAEIKTLRPNAKKQPLPPSLRTLQQLWFSQTPTLISGYHDGNGQFSFIEKTNVIENGALKGWEQRSQESLRKVVKLLRTIRTSMQDSAIMRLSPRKAAGIVLRSGKFAPTVTLHTLEPGYLENLPEDLRNLWN